MTYCTSAKLSVYMKKYIAVSEKISHNSIATTMGRNHLQLYGNFPNLSQTTVSRTNHHSQYYLYR